MNIHSIPVFRMPRAALRPHLRFALKNGLLATVVFSFRSAVFLAAFATFIASLHAADLNSTYEWNSVRIGAGGFVTGFVSHPLNANVRYCRTDVGNAYRWDAAINEWVPMIVRRTDGTGLPADVAAVPGYTGCSSIAVDPNNVNVVLIAFPVDRGSDLYLTYPDLPENVYRSTDGGRNFTKGNLGVPGGPNGSWRSNGERLKVDPNNGNIVYFCTYSSGLYRSLDAGATWAQVTGSGAPLASSTLINIHYYKSGGTTSAFGQTVSSILYAVGGNTDVFRSADGGQSWSNITSGTTLSTHTGASALDQNGALWVPQLSSTSLWKYNGAWTKYTVSTYDTLAGVTVDPANANRIFTVSNGGAVARSVNGGTSWTHLGRFGFANTFAWLPQPVGWRSNGGIYFDATGELWVPQGNEGILRYRPSVSNTEASINWVIESQGIEEMVANDIIIPKGSGDKVLTGVGDAVGHYITDPDQFTAKRHNVQNVTLLTTGNSISVCPNATSYVGMFAAGYVSGSNYSAYSTDTGSNWTLFPYDPSALNKTGAIAVSRRNGWGLNWDHMVLLPCNNKPPYYSKDGGASWTATASFALDANGNLSGKTAYAYNYLKQHPLKADPFVADKYYMNFLSGGFWVSTDGGVTWTQVANSGLPSNVYHGQIEVNYNVQDDLWFADGIGGATSHGLFHSAPGSNNVFTKVPGIDYAFSLALGAGRGQAGDAAYTVYFYGKLTGDTTWGIFRSINGGASWDRISYYPASIIDLPTCMTASWDTFGLVYVGFMGQSYVYGRPLEVFAQNFNSSTAIANYTGTGNNLFGVVSQGTNGGYSISGSNELVVTHGTDASDHIAKAYGGNLMLSFTNGFIFKGTIRAAANPNSYSDKTMGSLRFGYVTNQYDFTSALDIAIKISGTSTAPTVRLNGTGYAGASVGTPFWVVVNKTGGSITYTRPDGQSKTLANNQYDLWFGNDGNSGAQTNAALGNTTATLNAFAFQISGYYTTYSAAVAFDNIKMAAIDVGTTQF